MKWEKYEYSGIKYSLIIEVQIKHFYRGIKTCKLLNCGQVFLPHSSLLPYSSCRSNPQRPATLPACLRKEEVRKSLLRTLLDDRQLAASLPQNRRRTIILPEQIWREVMVEWSPDSWMGLAGTTASLPWKCSLDKNKIWAICTEFTVDLLLHCEFNRSRAHLARSHTEGIYATLCVYFSPGNPRQKHDDQFLVSSINLQMSWRKP